MEEKEKETETKKGNGKIIIVLALTAALLAGAGIGTYFIWQGANYLVTENARVTTTLFYITPSMPGTLERFTIRKGSYVRENEVLGWLEGGESFRSPVNGVVVRSFAEQNQAVSPAFPVAVIADTNNLHIQANIEETYIDRIQKGQAVTITIDALGRQRFTGYISEIGRVTDAALTGEMMSFTTSGRFTKVVQLLPVRINIIDDIDLGHLIGLNARIELRLGAAPVFAAGGSVFAEQPAQQPLNSITVRGIVESVERRNVFTALGNMVRRVYVTAGDRVTEGQVLGVLEDTDDSMLTVAYQQAESALRNARIELTARRTAHENNRFLYDGGAISRDDLRQSEDALAVAQNNYRDAQVLLNAALHTQGRMVIRSPINGVVTAVYAREGVPGPGLLFVVEDTDNLRIITRFREYDIGRINPGMDAAISSGAAGDTVYTGTITRINPAANANAHASIAEFEAEVAVTSPNTGLRIGMNARVTIIPE